MCRLESGKLENFDSGITRKPKDLWYSCHPSKLNSLEPSGSPAAWMVLHPYIVWYNALMKNMGLYCSEQLLFTTCRLSPRQLCLKIECVDVGGFCNHGTDSARQARLNYPPCSWILSRSYPEVVLDLILKKDFAIVDCFLLLSIIIFKY